MRLKGEPVKKRRRYDASRRQRAAADSRRRVVKAALAIFPVRGYAGTTVAAVASAAAVSVETVYKTFGGKPGLVQAVVDLALEGVGSVPAEQRSDAMWSHAQGPTEIIARWSELSKEVAPLVSPIELLVRAAAESDPGMAELWKRVNNARLTRMGHNADRLAARGMLRADVDADRARDVLFAYTAPELYELLVLNRGWTVDQYAEFLRRGLTAQLLEP